MKFDAIQSDMQKKPKQNKTKKLTSQKTKTT